MQESRILFEDGKAEQILIDNNSIYPLKKELHLPFVYTAIYSLSGVQTLLNKEVERACCQGGPRDIHLLTLVSEFSLSISEALDPGTSTTAFFLFGFHLLSTPSTSRTSG